MDSNERIIEEHTATLLNWFSTDMHWAMIYDHEKLVAAMQYREVRVGKYSFLEIPATGFKGILDGWVDKQLDREVAKCAESCGLSYNRWVEINARPDEERVMVFKPEHYMDSEGWSNIR